MEPACWTTVIDADTIDRSGYAWSIVPFFATLAVAQPPGLPAIVWDRELFWTCPLGWHLPVVAYANPGGR